MVAVDPRSLAVQELAAGIRQLERSRRHFDRADQAVVSTGIPALDALLPHQGMLRGTLTEWISGRAGAGAMTLAVQAAREARQTGPVMVVDPLHCFHAPAAGLMHLSLDSLVLVRPRSRNDALWAIEQALRCSAVDVVLISMSAPSARECRRLQLAAEAGGSVGLLVRPGVDRGPSTWADVRLQVEPVTGVRPDHVRRVRVNVRHARGNYCESGVVLDVCDETAVVHLVPELSAAAISPRAAGT